MEGRINEIFSLVLLLYLYGIVYQSNMYYVVK